VSEIPDAGSRIAEDESLTAADFEREVISASRRLLKTRSSPMPADFTGEAYLKSVWVSA